MTFLDTTRIWNSPYSGQIRLQGGSYSSYGRLEVYCNGEWGTVCDDGFGSTDARVACRQLGYSDSYTYTGNLLVDNVTPCTQYMQIASKSHILSYCHLILIVFLQSWFQFSKYLADLCLLQQFIQLS